MMNLNPKAQPILHDLPETCTGAKTMLRPYQSGDGISLWEAVEESRSHLRPWLPWVDSHVIPADSEAFARRAHARWLMREDLGYSLWDLSTGRFLGGIGMHPSQWEVPSFEIGYWLRVSAQGKGYMTEAVQLICQLAFETFKAERVFIRCDARNARSAAIPRRLGFQHEATLRSDNRDGVGALRDTLVFSMIAPEYRQREHGSAG